MSSQLLVVIHVLKLKMLLGGLLNLRTQTVNALVRVRDPRPVRPCSLSLLHLQFSVSDGLRKEVRRVKLGGEDRRGGDAAEAGGGGGRRAGLG